jgi:serine phosphatase RsbU (regulator of sigma subunit)
VLLNPQRDQVLQQIHTQGERLGVTSGQQFRNSLRPISIQLQIGDIIAFFTDGVAQAFNPRDLNAGRLSVMGGFASHQELPCGMMVAKVLEEAKARLSGPPTEDLSALAIRVKHPDESGSGITTVQAPVARPIHDPNKRR